MTETLKNIIKNISVSKKYKSLYEETIKRIAEECINRYGEKRAEKEARNKLHQIWGSYYKSRPKFPKILKNFQKSYNKDMIINLLKLQSSTNERIPILSTFYKDIFSITGKPKSIIDHACGLNPLTYSWMNLPEGTKYTAFDIDIDQIKFLNSIFDFLKIQNFEFKLGDIISEEFDYTDVIFLLKLLPLLEQQKKGCSLEILKRQKCKFLVISYPITSLSGKQKGMLNFYIKQLTELIKDEKWITYRLVFDTELVFVIRK